MAEGNKKGFDTNSNSYTIIYSIIIVVLVAFLLAFVFQALKPMQDANVALDKKKQILYSLNIGGLSDRDVAAKYDEVVLADEIMDARGNVLEKGERGGEKAGFRLNSSDFKHGRLALFVCKVNGQTKYVIPVYGTCGGASAATSPSTPTSQPSSEPISTTKAKPPGWELR